MSASTFKFNGTLDCDVEEKEEECDVGLPQTRSDLMEINSINNSINGTSSSINETMNGTNSIRGTVHNLKTLFHSKKFSDVEFILGGNNKKSINEGVIDEKNINSLKAHKCILSEFSSYFESLFNFEKGDKIHIKDVNFLSFEIVIEYIYTGELNYDYKIRESSGKFNPLEVFVDIIILADMYILTKLQDDCITFLEKDNRFDDPHFILPIVSNCFHIPFMKNICISKIVKNFKRFI
jgi:hypothetical protein